MSSALACYAADRFTALIADVGIRAGAPTTSADGSPIPDPATCRPARPLPIYALHGTADQTNPYDGGGQPDWQYSVPQAIARWAELDGCPADASTRALSGTVDEIAYTSCSPGGFAPPATVVLYRVNGGGHVWFAGDNGAPDASQVISDVVARHALKPPALRVSGLPTGCVRRSFVLKVRASTDSPVARLEMRLAGRRLLRVSRRVAHVRVRRIHRATSRLAVTVTDRAGLRRVVSKTLRRCGS
jgi:poly(3-hydroxybutyrate) depolymerase